MAQTNRSTKTPMLLLQSKLKKKLRSEVTAINQSQVNSSSTIGCCEYELQCCQLWRRIYILVSIIDGIDISITEFHGNFENRLQASISVRFE